MFAVHGVMEEFSSLPRIFRDVVVNEQWEWPRNLLQKQIYREQLPNGTYSALHSLKLTADSSNRGQLMERGETLLKASRTFE
ncbi:hypothetical protein [Neobacillus sp. 114]|uniref:hypothetical protein n=1 Tax=Neobacillus sp. 114 TaxID=3048535 RepID=UPI0024C2700E|nr:hypothetical protein [Neobacillus sp. 114]